uniref:Pentacotripeptide-repeat region of PRORP domain-containing protein n=1 Tax=Glycine max TaxID=3847 RepID=A0A0R0FDR5_SOYBN
MPLTPPSSQAPQSRKISPLRHVAADPALLLSHAPRIVVAIRYPFPEDMPLTLLKAYAKTRMPDEALHVFQTMPHVFGCSPTICSFNTLLNAFVESHQWARVENFFKYFEAACVTSNVETYNVLLKVLCKKGEFEKGRGLLTWMWGAGMSLDKITYRTLIGGVAKRVEPDVVCYNMIIDGFFKRGYFVKAGEMWERLLREESVFPSVVSYNVMISGLCRCGRMKRNERKCDLFTYSALIHGLSEVGNLGEARRVYEEMVGRGGLFENGKVDKAMVLWDGLTEADSATYGVVIHGLCRNGYVNRALQVLEEAEHRGGGVDEFAYLSLINALCKEGRLDEAGGVFVKHFKLDSAVKAFREMSSKGCWPTVVSYNILINGLLRAGRFREAYDCVNEMLEKGWKPDIITYSTLIDGLCESKMIDTAFRLWHEFLDTGHKPDITMYNIAIDFLYSTMRQKNCVNLVTHNTIMEGFYKDGNCKMASKIWAHILEDKLQPDIILVTDAVGFLDDALGCGVLPTAITWNILVRAVIF